MACGYFNCSVISHSQRLLTGERRYRVCVFLQTIFIAALVHDALYQNDEYKRQQTALMIAFGTGAILIGLLVYQAYQAIWR